MPWMTKKFKENLDKIKTNNLTSYDKEVYDITIELRRQVIYGINNYALRGYVLDEESTRGTPYESQIVELKSENSWLGDIYLYEMPLDNWPRQIVYIIYTDTKLSTPQQLSSPGFLLFNVRLGEKAVMLHGW